VGHDEDVALAHGLADPLEGVEDPGLEPLVGLEGRRPAPIVQVARPRLGDLGLRQALPLAGVALAEAGVDQDGPDPDQLGDDLGRDPGPLEVAGHDGVDRAHPLRGVGGLVQAQLGEGRIGLALPAADGVPLGLAVADDEHAEHGRGR
jgi:hypothetical protein